MYYVMVVALTLVAPVGAALIDPSQRHDAHGLILLLGKWYVFFAAGVRLFIAGLRQTFQPRFTLRQIFEIDDDASLQIVQELGFANISMGLLGLVSLLDPVLTLAGALVGGLYYGLAGLKHALTRGHNPMRMVAMVTDILVFAVLAAYVAAIVIPPVLALGR